MSNTTQPNAATQPAMSPAMYELMLNTLKQVVRTSGFAFGAVAESSFFSAMMERGTCVEVRLGGSRFAHIVDVGVTDAGRVRFMLGDKEDMKLRTQFDAPIQAWVEKNRQQPQADDVAR